jgi:hypothetical protein
MYERPKKIKTALIYVDSIRKIADVYNSLCPFVKGFVDSNTYCFKFANSIETKLYQ